MKKAVALLSGGLDSSTLLWQLRYEDIEPTALIINYGQRHVREIASARQIVNCFGCTFVILDLDAALMPIFSGAHSSQVGRFEDVPHGHYAAENMKTTIVPNRNMLLIALAGALAESAGAELVCFAAHAGDHAVYPDCRPEFNESAAETLFRATDGRVTVYNPFINISKTDIVQRAKQLGVPLGLTWSCYDPKIGTYEKTAYHCGLCGTCVERKEAFREAGVDDPTVYSA